MSMAKARFRFRSAVLSPLRLPFACLLLALGILNGFADTIFARGVGGAEFQRVAPQPEAPQSAISMILQDRRGFLWFASEQGVHRYDARAFVLYRPYPDKSSLDNAVTSLCLDSGGTLWCAVGNRALRFDRRSERWREIQSLCDNDDRNDSLANDLIVALFADARGDVWIARERSLELRRSDKPNAVTQRFSHAHSRIRAVVLAESLRPAERAFWIATERGIERFCVASGKWEPALGLSNDGDQRKKNQQPRPLSSRASVSRASPLFSSNDVSSLFYSPSDSLLFIGLSDGSVWTLASHKSTPRFVTSFAVNVAINLAAKLAVSPGARVLAFTRDARGAIWCSSAGAGGGARALRKDSLERYAATHYSFGGGRFFTALFTDRQGIIWFGATDGSLYKSDPFARKFFPVKPRLERALGGKKNFVTLCLYEDSEKKLWLGAEQGLLCHDPQRGTWKAFRHDPRNPHSISSDNISCIYEDRRGRLWIGTTAGGLNLYDRQSGRFRAFRHNPKDSASLGSDNISCIYEDRRGRLWVGTWINGMYLFDAKTETFLSYRSQPDKISTLSSNSISFIAEDRALADGTLWIGTYEDGLNAFHPTIQAFTRHFHSPDNPRSLSSNAVSSVCELPDGALWVTTDAGLDKFDRQRQEFTRYDARHGLPNEALSVALADKRGNLWIMSASAISVFNPATEKAHIYDASDGLGQFSPAPLSASVSFSAPASSALALSSHTVGGEIEPEQFSSRAYFQASDGSIYFGTASGFVYFHPDSVRHNALAPPVVITALKKFNRRATLPVAVSEADTVELSYLDNFIAFEFAALNFSAPEKNRYQYKLEGFDRQWIDAGAKNEAVYTNLDGGTYLFRVIACNNDGLWNERGAALWVIVRPPFWRTKWFFVCSALVIAGATWGSFRWRVRRLRARAAELERVVEERTAQLRRSLEDLERQKQETENHAREAERLNAALNAHNAELAAQTRVAQLEMLRYQLNPHFLFNALISIQDLAREDAAHASRALTALMAYLRYALQPAGLPTVTLSEEIAAVQSYLEIEKVRFEERLRIWFEINDDASRARVPAFVLQPLVENAIKYGMRTSPMPLEICIAASLRASESAAPFAQTLTLEVWNSGSLHLPENAYKPDGTGTGLRNIRERLQALFPKRHSLTLAEEPREGRTFVCARLTVLLP
jgi:ligand-binding sensor domain-containing protein